MKYYNELAYTLSNGQSLHPSSYYFLISMILLSHLFILYSSRDASYVLLVANIKINL